MEIRGQCPADQHRGTWLCVILAVKDRLEVVARCIKDFMVVISLRFKFIVVRTEIYTDSYMDISR